MTLQQKLSITSFTRAALSVLLSAATACGEPEDAPGDVSASDAGNGGADFGSDDDASDCWAWITPDTPTCALGCQTMYGDANIEVCEFTVGGFAPDEPIFCFPGRGVSEAVECMQHNGTTFYTIGGVVGMEHLDGWSVCECG